MDKEKQKQFSNSPIVVWLGIISSIIAIFAFVTGYQSLSAITTQISPTPVEPSAPIDIDPLPEKTIVGLWERRSSEITANLIFNRMALIPLKPEIIVQRGCCCQ